MRHFLQCAWAAVGGGAWLVAARVSQLRWRHPATALVGLLCLTACVSEGAVRTRTTEIRQVLEPRHARAERCSPRELAYGEVLAGAADFESSRGHSTRARQHMEVATELARNVYAAVEDGGERCAPDADLDGIPDSVDLCRLEPEDFDGHEDDDGCPEQDRDNDGISDRRDRCPDVPEDRDDFEDDDGCPDPDNDGDGVLDEHDVCPLLAEDLDGFDDDDGCPDPDNDGDGIPDVADKCPDEPEDFDGDQDEDGCPDTYRDIVVENNAIVLKKKVFFGTNKTAVLPESFPMLLEVADVLVRRPTMRVRVEGHTDSRGSERRNEKLSSGRAESVRRFLIGQGATPDQLTAVGFGESRPIADNDTDAGRAINRRVEFHIISK